MRVAIPTEVMPGERRVAIVPQLVNELIQAKCQILLEKNAGLAADFPDAVFQNVEFYNDNETLYQQADIVFKVNIPTKDEIALLKSSTVLVSFLFPNRYSENIIALRDKNITSFGMELIPRISRAQSMDALSSQATVAGYKSALLAANLFPRFFPMLTTAAGTIRPASVLVIGAGVAGLQAIATSRRLGAIVKAYDIRSAAREQVESLGAKMINIDVKAEAAGGYARELTQEEQQKQREVLYATIAKTDIIITTALIPGRPAPKIITREMVELMSPGSLIIDIAAEAGGNCELTQIDKLIKYKEVTIYGPVNLPSMVARDASTMYAKNLINFLKLFVKDGKCEFDWNDPILAQSVVTHEGIIKQESIKNMIEGAKS